MGENLNYQMLPIDYLYEGSEMDNFPSINFRI